MTKKAWLEKYTEVCPELSFDGTGKYYKKSGWPMLSTYVCPDCRHSVKKAWCVCPYCGKRLNWKNIKGVKNDK